MELTSASPGETEEIGANLSRVLRGGDVVCLEGGLGSGKTVFVKGMARGLEYGDPVTSPTFTIIQLYREARLCHVDAYRLDGPDDLVDAGIEEYLDDWICAVEWADSVRAALPEVAFTVRLSFGGGDEERRLTIEAPGGLARRLESAFETRGARGDGR